MALLLQLQITGNGPFGWPTTAAARFDGRPFDGGSSSSSLVTGRHLNSRYRAIS